MIVLGGGVDAQWDFANKRAEGVGTMRWPLDEYYQGHWKAGQPIDGRVVWRARWAHEVLFLKRNNCRQRC
jgi:hypothetical protein